MSNELPDGEWDERVSITFRGGYYSVFGDENLVEGDFCQHCIKDLLGQWLRVFVDDPFQPRRQPAYAETRAYQDYQLRRNRFSMDTLLRGFGVAKEGAGATRDRGAPGGWPCVPGGVG